MLIKEVISHPFLEFNPSLAIPNFNIMSLQTWLRASQVSSPKLSGVTTWLSSKTRPDSDFRIDRDMGPLLLTWININLNISNHMSSGVWDKITFPFLNFNGSTLRMVKLFHLTLYNGCNWPALRAGLLCCNFFGQPGSVSKFPPLSWVKLWVGWVGRGYTEISRYFPASWINWVTLVTKIKLLYSLRF